MGKKTIQQVFGRYQQQVSALLTEMSAYSDEVLNRKPADGGWSAIQTMHHLIVSEEMSWAYVEKKMGYEPNPTKTVGLSEHWRSFLIWAGLKLPIKIKVPKVLEEKQNLLEYKSLKDTQLRWEAALAAGARFLDNMPESLADKVVYKHPRGGKIGWAHMIAFFQAHFERHRKQIRRAVQ